ncbi:metal ABC transporter ATP-binding protein [Streptomyces sp. 7-21]|uniref:metal ABC transporter ATP-binding protein n=1 Tax=Streptomyces sp. 7-21 TaxID=2802283 RepID=UPI00191EEF90|nr:ABC transporter ATP-binding protein [Streptomyces sp. 7-21]MBL1067047.1 ABC transporter ATP-binding protein [Streptomyces sp. 7-21]
MRLRGVSRRYRRTGPWVLRDVDLELTPGSLTRVTGGNGSGKSTLLRLLAGVDAPDAGRITGRPRAVAYVPERFPPGLPLTALGYLTHLGRVHGLPGADAAREAGRWLARLGADGLAAHPLRELSKGSCQKVAVAQALLARPALLVLDEAWTGLDLPARETLDAAVRERVADGAAVVFVDHDPRRLAGEASRVLLLAGGRLTAAPAAAVPPQDRVAVIEAVGPPGGAPPARLPGRPRWRRLPDGALRLTVADADSDAVLAALLAARPAWHVRAVATGQRPGAQPGGMPRPGAAGEEEER